MPALTELELRLAGPDREPVRAALMAALAEQEIQLRQAIAKRLPREDFAVAAALLDATQAAQEVLARPPGRGRA